MAEVYHALGLHMHQPPGNLVALHAQSYLAASTMPPLSIIAFKFERVAIPSPAEAKSVEETQ